MNGRNFGGGQKIGSPWRIFLFVLVGLGILALLLPLGYLAYLRYEGC